MDKLINMRTKLRKSLKVIKKKQIKHYFVGFFQNILCIHIPGPP